MNRTFFIFNWTTHKKENDFPSIVTVHKVTTFFTFSFSLYKLGAVKNINRFNLLNFPQFACIEYTNLPFADDRLTF